MAVGLEPLRGVPVTLTSTSGNLAQPVAGVKPQRAAAGPDLRELAERVHAELLAGLDADERELAGHVLDAPVGRRARLGVAGDRVQQAGGGMRPSGPYIR